MKKIFSLMFIICITLSFSILACGGDLEEGFAGFVFNVELDGDTATIPVSELSRVLGADFSFRADSGFLFSEKDGNSFFLKLLDEQFKLDEAGLSLYGYDKDKPYNSYNLRFFISYISPTQNQSATDVFSAQEQFDSAATEVEASILIKGNLAYVSIEEKGTSPVVINNELLSGEVEDNLLLVNRNNPLAKDYVPQQLTDVKTSKAKLSYRMKIDRETMDKLNELLEAAHNEGIKGFVISSVYRPFAKQTELYNNRVALLSKSLSRSAALEEAAKVVAIPGTSEHQTGMAVDISNENVSLVGAFGNTVQGKWLEENSWKYGFIVRYQADKSDITGIIYEPWHIRYVGKGHAEVMKSRNLCLEEYIQYLKENRMVAFSSADGSSYIVRYIDKTDLDGTGLALNLPEGYNWSVSKADKDGYVLTIEY